MTSRKPQLPARVIDAEVTKAVERGLQSAADRLHRAHTAARAKAGHVGPHQQHYRDRALVHRLARNEILSMLERFKARAPETGR